MKAIDPGHLYALAHLDGGAAEGATADATADASGAVLGSELLRFVKRVGDDYPGNEGDPYAGTTTQEVLRALIDRMKYVHGQAAVLGDRASTGYDWIVIKHLREAMWLLEERAAHRADRPWPCVGTDAPEVELIPVCAGCGHIGCEGRACGR